MTRWPPIVWPLMTVGSLLLLMGLGNWEDDALLIGTIAVVGVFVLALYITHRRWRDRPGGTGYAYGMAGLAAFYVVNAIAAAFAGGEYVPIAILASLIPASAAMLLFATMRSKTPHEGAVRDPMAAAHRDPYPGMGMDDETPLGDTSEHSDAAEGTPVKKQTLS